MSATSARTRFLAHVAANGWVLDPAQTIRRLVKGGRYGEPAQYEDVQNPFAFTRHVFDDVTGQWAGQWHVLLDYSTNQYSYSSRSSGNTLRRLVLHYTPAEGERRLIGTMVNITTRRHRHNYSDLFEVAGCDANGETIYSKAGEPLSLRERAEKLIIDPALTAWLALENEHQRKVREAEYTEKRRRDEEEAARPLPVTVGQEGYNSEWKQLTGKLEKAARHVEQANGKSDLPALIARVDEVLGELIHALAPEARAALDELLAPDYTTAIAAHSADRP